MARQSTCGLRARGTTRVRRHDARETDTHEKLTFNGNRKKELSWVSLFGPKQETEPAQTRNVSHLLAHCVYLHGILRRDLLVCLHFSRSRGRAVHAGGGKIRRTTNQPTSTVDVSLRKTRFLPMPQCQQSSKPVTNQAPCTHVSVRGGCRVSCHSSAGHATDNITHEPYCVLPPPSLRQTTKPSTTAIPPHKRVTDIP